MDDSGVILFLCLVIIVLGYLLLGLGMPKMPSLHRKPKSRFVDVVGPDGEVYKAEIVEKKKKTVEKKKSGWKYRSS